ncbi:hypothetical protein [Staphylococcus sp. 17KM0847]|uniref:hypothetical protein n=1 Tax=Staphylococcus sp. 17KM0847 TaxID=2583989 RepID=UPI0015DC0F88|nr:hypothetical protein [Staphylococcus sp. 17KM0847]QLK85925.1 hypothetical protein FGL66_03980 [Staphylococcus sp. 17KM0847]
MNFELSLIIIQTITGIISLFLGFKATKLNQESYKNSNNSYINEGIHNQTYIEVTSITDNDIIEKKVRYLKYFHWIFNIAFFGTGIYTFIKMFPNMLKQIKIFDGGITLTNLTKLLTLSLQNALLGSLIINIIGGLILIIFTLIKPYYTKKRIPLSIIIVLTNIILFIDLFKNDYHNNIEITFSNSNSLINILTIFFILITMLLVLANNMILGIYLFNLKSYNNELADPLTRISIIFTTIIIYGLSKWIIFYSGLEFIKEQLINHLK